MDRRKFLLSTAWSASLFAVPRLAFAADGMINVYTGSDSNISDFWTNEILPRFEKANSGYQARIIDAGDGSGLRAIADRAMAAKNNGTDPQVEMFEAYDPFINKGAIEDGLWVNFKKAGLENYSHVNPAAIQSDYGLPYRGSQVLLAYDKSRLKPQDAPKSWDALVRWIKANPGKFIYNRPDKGGSGGNFVRRAIHQANGLDPNRFTLRNYSDDYAGKTLAPAWKILNDIAPYLYEKGRYTSGNTQSIQLLSQGVVVMTPVWSDQVLQAMSQGVLDPETTGLVQLRDLALCGGFARIVMPTNAKALDGAKALASFVLSNEIQTLIITRLGGFPGVSWDYLNPDIKQKYKDVIPSSIPSFPGGNWGNAVNDGWYRNVAPNVKRG